MRSRACGWRRNGPDAARARGVARRRQARVQAPDAHEACEAHEGDDWANHRHSSPERDDASQSVPIVFTNVIDPVGAGFVESLARPGGNTTGFALFEYAIAGKWLELLKETAPDVTQVAVLRDPTIAAGIEQFAAIQASGVIGIDLSAMDIRDGAIIERGVATFARGSNRALIVTASPFGANHPDFIVTLATRYKLPAIFPFRYFVTAGGLLSYGPDTLNPFGPAANYINRILNGETPADVPVQAPTKYELLINIRTAKSLGIEIPASLLTCADELIE